ncbi:MAG: hypothetical protein WCK35_16570 [Chloroflexota bacterium]
MVNTEKFLVGFDRFITLEWADFALELTLRNDTDRNQKITELKEWMSVRVNGDTAARKTVNVLTRLWIDTIPDLALLKSNARLLYHDTYNDEKVIFHWGMALASFPLFRETVLQAGRLISLQGYFKRSEIHQRVMEHYSNQSTVLRSVNQIIQSLVNWQVLKLVDNSLRPSEKKSILTDKLQIWLLEAILMAMPGHRILLNDIFRSPELFPFEFLGNHRNSINSSGLLTLERDGTNLEYVVPYIDFMKPQISEGN